MADSSYKVADGGHTFVKKNFHKPTYCHHCSDLLWFGLIGQGYICEVCNFIIHERCVTNVVTPCSGIAPCIIKNPVAHCWSEPTHHRKKFCTVCRKRLDETPAVHCLVCDYFAHTECQDFAVPDCTENATYVPGKELLNVKHQHHWREGNLPPTSKCFYCKKTCWSSECLTGYRCEWCGLTTHGGCRMYLLNECNFGILQPIYLPPHAVSIPRTEVPIEAIIGVQVKSKSGLVRDYSCPYKSIRHVSNRDVEPRISQQINLSNHEKLHTPEMSLKEILIIERQKRVRMKEIFLSSVPKQAPIDVECSHKTSFPLTAITNDNWNLDDYQKIESLSADNASDNKLKHRNGERIRIKREKIRHGNRSESFFEKAGNYLNPINDKSIDDCLEHFAHIEDKWKEQQNHHKQYPENSSDIISENGDDDDDDDMTNILVHDKELFNKTNDKLPVNYQEQKKLQQRQRQRSQQQEKLLLDEMKNVSVPSTITVTVAPVTSTIIQPAKSLMLLTNSNCSNCFYHRNNDQLNHSCSLVSTSTSRMECCQSNIQRYKQEVGQLERSGRKKRRQRNGDSLLQHYKNIGNFLKKHNFNLLKMNPAQTLTNKTTNRKDGDGAIYQNVSITIQDEDGNYQLYDDNYEILISEENPAIRESSKKISLSHENIDLSSQYDYDAKTIDNYFSDNNNDDDDDHNKSDINNDIHVKRHFRVAHEINENHYKRLLNKLRLLFVNKRKAHNYKLRARSISEEFSSGDTPRIKEDEASIGKGDGLLSSSGVSGAGGSTGMIATIGSSSASSASHYRPDLSSSHKSDKSERDKEKREKEREEKDIEAIKVFDGNNSYRRQLYRVIIVPRSYTLEQLLTTALRAFHITRDSSAFYLTDLYAPAGSEDAPLQDPNPVHTLIHLEGKRPAIYLRFHDKDYGHVRVYPGKLQCSLEEPYVNVPVDDTTTITDLIRNALNSFGLQDNHIDNYRCSEVLLDRGVTERILSLKERPWEITKQLGKESIRQMELMRFYMQHKQDPHGPNIALFVGNLPPGLSQRNYEQILNRYVTDENKFTSIGPIYYEYGSVVLTFEDAQKAVRAFYNLRETIIEDKKLLVLLLPNIEPSMVPSDVRPLLVFVNVKSGGCQGLELISSFRKLLNPFQVFDLDNGGPLPGLYVFRQIANYKILVCGGDGTIGWVLQCLDNVGQDSECSSPPCAIVPLGTGNDLARVLCWGSGYTGGEDPLNLLRDVIDAEEIRLDRWTVVFHPEERPEEPAIKPPSNTTGGGAQNEDNSQIFVMNNYFGIGVDADLCLDFHNAREENPNKFNSRLHNKGYYVKMGLRKIVGRKTVKDLHKELRLEVDGKVIELPPVEGIIILNILSWGSGANPWGPDKDDNFSTPNHYDGVLEIVGVSGVVHLGQIQSGIRTATRIAQGGHIKIHLYSDMPVQVDGEPWVQSPGDVVVLKSALKATMLKKMKSKRRLTEPYIMTSVTMGATITTTTTTAATSMSSSSTILQGISTTPLTTATTAAVVVTSEQLDISDQDKEEEITTNT